MAFFKQAHCLEHTPHQPGHGGFSGTRRAGKHGVQGGFSDRDAPFLAFFLDPDKFQQRVNVAFDLFQPGKVVQLRQQGFNRLRPVSRLNFRRSRQVCSSIRMGLLIAQLHS